MALKLEDVAALALPDVDDTSRKDWAAAQNTMGRRVKAFRDYAEGRHPNALTPDMRAALRIKDGDLFAEFTDNYMDIIIQTAADRLRVSALDTPVDAERDWADNLLRDTRFDALQTDLWEAALRDGDTYLMVYYDNERGRCLFSHEPAFDGTTGMLTYYESTVSSAPGVAIKVWPIGKNYRLNVYRPEGVERYLSIDGGALEPFNTPEQPAKVSFALVDGRPLGLPVFHFRNRRRSGTPYGLSDLEPAIPLQNALNRTMYSMVFSAELSAFMIRFARGFEPPASITPGSWITAGFRDADGKITAPASAEEAAGLNSVTATALEQAELAPYLEVARWLKAEVSFTTRTPAPEFMGSDSASGEALKQREIGLIGKVRRFQTKAGNVVEDAVRYAARMEQAYGTGGSPEFESLSCEWESPEVRNQVDVVENAVKLAERVSDREFLRLVAPVYGWSEQKIDAIIAERAADQARGIAAAAALIPTYGQSEQEPLGQIAETEPNSTETPETGATPNRA